MTTELEKELTKACGLKISKAGDRQAYLFKLVTAVNELDDDTWNNQLSTAAQNWQNVAIEAHTAQQDIPDFAGDDAEEAEAEEEVEEVAASAPPVKAKKEKSVAKTVKRTEAGNGKEKPVVKTATKLMTRLAKTAKPVAKPAKAKPARAEKPGLSATVVIQDMLVKNVNATTKELAEAVLKKGRGEVSDRVIQGIAYPKREMFRAIEQAGLLKRALPPRP